MASPKAKGSDAANAEASQEITDAAIIAHSPPSAQELALVKESFALRGHAVSRAHHRDGRVTYTVALRTYSRTFTSWRDVLEFLTRIGGAS